ncbi:uncharacterized protein LOC110460569, partial [Mizuhopecten yessoensis]|uniref:uncharacterized protein LOC110460569 n=1 Tax=Mizuhopecten yessoensis TaxID=6573 RepID=UPI000B458D56
MVKRNTSDNLQQFVTGQQAVERDERERTRDERQAEAARQHEIQMEKIREEQAERNHARKLDLIKEEAKGQNEGVRDIPRMHANAVKGPKLPAFEEGKDNMNSYINRFERYAIVQGWKKEQWGANLSALLKGRALDVFSRLPMEQSLDFEELKKALLTRFELTEEGFWKKFRSTRPETGETLTQFAFRLDSYFMRWLDMTRTAKDFESLKDLMIRDQFIHCCGKDLALFLKERVPKAMHGMSMLADQYAEARGSTSGMMSGKASSKPMERTSSQNVTNTSDSKIGKSGNHNSNRQCYSCGKMGHLSFECRNKRPGNTKNVAAVTVDSSTTTCNRQTSTRGKGTRKRGSRGRGKSEETVASLSNSCDSGLGKRSRPVSRGYVGDHSVTVLRDSGCDGVVVRKSLVESHQLTGKIQTCYLADGTPIFAPVANAFVDTPFLTGRVEVWTLESPLYDLIIGDVEGAREPKDPDPEWKVKEPVVHAVETRAQRKETEKHYRPMKVPSALQDCTIDDLKREQKDDKSLSKMWRLAETAEVCERNDVKKKDGTNRFCIDFRQLNRVTIFDAEPMPNTEDMFSRLGGFRYFSKLDLTKGYWQVPMAETAKEKTAFITPVGLFQFRVMPFGLVNAPATFCRLMRKVLDGLRNVDSFVDDILIYTHSFEEHMYVLKDLFRRLRKAGLSARPTKCFIGYRSLECLGHVVDDQRLEPQPEKISAIEQALRPETKTQLRSFLGLAGFYRKFIANFASIAVPLTELTKKGFPNRLEWGDSQEKAFETLKRALTAKPILKLPDLNEDFNFRTDASDTGLGA